MIPQSTDLDRIDLRILDVLQRDGRTTSLRCTALGHGPLKSCAKPRRLRLYRLCRRADWR